MNPPVRLLRTALLGLTALLPLASFGATVTWSGASGGDWNTGANWGGTKPGSGDTAVFSTSITSVTNSLANQALTTIQFGTTSIGSITIGSTSGNSITLASGGQIAVLNTVTANLLTETINAPLILASASPTTNGAYTFTNNATMVTTKLVIGGSVTGGTTTGAITLTLTGSSIQQQGTNEIKGIISDGGAAGGVSLVKANTARWILSNDSNSFSGGVSVNSGTLSVTSLGTTGQNSALGTNGIIKMGTGANAGSLLYTGAGETSDKNFALTGAAGGGASIYSGGGNLTLTGNITATSSGAKTLTLRANGGGLINTNLLSGKITDGVGIISLAKNDGNTWILTGENDYSGTTSVGNGVLQIGNGGTSGKLGTGSVSVTSTLTFNRSDALAVANDISGAGVINQNGSGTLTLNGINTQTGATTINAGTLSVGVIGNGDSTSSNLSAATNAAANLVFNGGGLQYTGATASTDRNFTINAGKTATFDVTTNNLTLTGNSTATNGALAKIGAGTLTLAGANLYTGATSVTQGTLVVNGSIATSSGVTLASHASLFGTGAVSGVTLAGNNTLSSSGTLTTSGLTISGTGNEFTSGTIAGNASVSGDASVSILLGATLQGGLTASGSVVNNGTINGTVAIANGGLLGGSGTITGATTIASGGTLSPGNSPGLLTFNSDLTLNGTTLLQIAGTDRGTTYDAINVGGTLTYGGTLSVVFSSTLAGGEAFALFAGADGTSAPTTAGQAVSVLLSGNGYDGALTRIGNVWTGAGIGGLNFSFNESTGVLSAASAIPEPSTYALLIGGLALGGVLLARRRRS